MALLSMRVATLDIGIHPVSLRTVLDAIATDDNARVQETAVAAHLHCLRYFLQYEAHIIMHYLKVRMMPTTMPDVSLVPE